jgi:hypothetical protein
MHVWCKLLKILNNLHWGHSDLTIVLERRSTVRISTIKKIFNCLKSIDILLYCDKRNFFLGVGVGGVSDILTNKPYIRMKKLCWFCWSGIEKKCYLVPLRNYRFSFSKIRYFWKNTNDFNFKMDKNNQNVPIMEIDLF